MGNGAQEPVPERKGLGCLLALLLGASLVSGLLWLVGLVGLVLGLVGKTFDGDGGATGHWFRVTVILFLFTPMVILFGRGAYLPLLRIRGRPTPPLVTVGLATLIALVYGLPGRTALGLTDSDPVPLSVLVHGGFGSLLLLGAPFYLWRMDRDQS